MNQPNAFTAIEEVKSSVFVSERSQTQTVVCPKPRRISHLDDLHNPLRSFRRHVSHQVELSESKAEIDILDIILTKDGCGAEQFRTPLASSPPLFCGSPPSRASNPLTQDARFRDELNITPLSPMLATSGLPSSPSSSARKGGCVRGSFGGSPAVRIEGFDCLDRDRRNCSIPALA